MRTSAPPASPRRGGIIAALRRRPLKRLLLGATGMVVLFFVVVLVLLEVSVTRNNRLVESLVGGDAAIAELCAASIAEMLDARRYEKDFLINYKEFGLDEARARYITLLVTEVDELKGNMARMRALAADPEMARLTREVERPLADYRAGVEAMAEAYATRGHIDTGTYGAMRARAREIEALVRAGGGDALYLRLLAVRRAEKDYIERTKDSDVAAVRDALGEFDAAIGASPLGARTRAQLRELTARYLAHFERYVQTTEEIRAIKRHYLKAVQEIDPALEKLSALAHERVKAKQRAIEVNARRVRLPVIVLGVAVLAATGLLAAALVVAVARSVSETQSFAERIAGGDLGSRLAPEGRNEFSSLAVALNGMAESLQKAAEARERTLAALWDSEEKYRALVETSADWIWEIDLGGRHTYTNDRLREILGLEPGELLSRPAGDFLHPDDVSLAARTFSSGIASGRGWQGVALRWRHRDGSYRWLESSAVAVRDRRGELTGFRGTDRDITERRKMEAELVRTQKLEAIGTLAGGIAHDFNNLLQGLFGYLSLARLNIRDPEKAGATLDQAEKALTLSVNLTTQLLTFAKGGMPVKIRLALPPVIKDTARLALSGSRSDCRILVAPDLRPVHADPGQLAQVIQNLVINASDAMPQGGTVEIEAANVVVAPGSNPFVPDGGAFVRIAVRDSGVGISGPHLSRIFDPYFTTKQQGSGLGLATSYSIVRAHGGFIDVTSRLGEGSEFSVYLPATPGGGVEPPAPALPPPAARAAAARVLVMDDEEMVRHVAAEMLAGLDCAATTVASGEEALAAFRRARAEGVPFDVVILDLTVKTGMGGEETVRRLRELDPAVIAVVSSGYSDAAVVANYRAHGFSGYLNKPYRMAALSDCLRSLLPAGGASRPTSPR